MAAFHDYIEHGLHQAQIELESDDPFFPAPDDVGTVLKYALVSLLADTWGSVKEIRRRVRAGEISRRELEVAAGEQLPGLLHAGGYEDGPRERVIDLAVDALLSERLCPELRLASAARSLSGVPVHALVFSAFPHVTNELYPLMIDAFVAGSVSGHRVQVVGVHEDWLDNGKICRAILFEEDTLELIEADLLEPVAPRTAQVTALNLAEEQASHARIERALGNTPILNPAAGARRLDDKAETASIWQQAGVPTPAFLAIPTDADPASAREMVARFAAAHGPALVIKPPDGTEGRGVMLVEWSSLTADSVGSEGLLAGHLISEQRGNLRYAGADGPLRCTARLNVSWDGKRGWAESGYAQVASSPEGIASAGRGGRLVTLVDLWAHLCRTDGNPFMPTGADWTCLLNTAITGVEALARELGADMPALVGIDVLLDEGADGSLQPVLLEANPRPAGLSHSRLLTSAGPTNDPGVSLHLWEVVNMRGQ